MRRPLDELACEEALKKIACEVASDNACDEALEVLPGNRR